MTEPDHDAVRRILMVSYWYPPAVGAASERVAAFARHLPDHGWETHVLTARRVPAPAERAGVEVHAIPDRFASKGQTFADYDPRQRPSRLQPWLRDLVFPDRFVGWQRRALGAGLEIVRRRGADVILASFPPASAVQLALQLHRRTGVPLVLDFRDRWFGPGGYIPRRAQARRAHEELQREAVAATTSIVTISDAMADAIADEHLYPRRRIAVISNGFDADRPRPERRSPDAERIFTIAHVGTVIPRNRPDLFFASVAAWKLRGGPNRVRFRFVGNLSKDYLRSAGLDDVVETTGLVPRDRALQEMADADALLLLTGRYVGRWGHNAKLFEYLAAGRPILCLEESPPSNDRTLLESVAPERSFFAAVDDPAALAVAVAAVRAWLDAPEATATATVPNIEAFSRARLTAALADHLRERF
ncbi:MAG: glycosyltransferase [Phycisphaerae bacterium]